MPSTCTGVPEEGTWGQLVSNIEGWSLFLFLFVNERKLTVLGGTLLLGNVKVVRVQIIDGLFNAQGRDEGVGCLKSVVHAKQKLYFPDVQKKQASGGETRK